MNKFLYRKVLALIVAAIAVVAVYFYTETTIQSEVSPTAAVVAIQDIPPHTEITKEMVIVREVPERALPSDHIIASSLDQVVGKWTVEGYGIASKGFINTKKILPKEELPDSGLLELKKGEYAFSTSVDLGTSHGNTIRPGTKVDLYLAADFNKKQLTENMLKSQGWDDSSKFLDDSVYYFGRTVVEARVVEVKDNQGKKVFTSADYTDAPDGTKAKSNNSQKIAKLYTLAVDLEDLQLLNKASMFGKIIPVVSGTSYNELDIALDGTQDIPDMMSDVEDTIKIIQSVTLNPKHK
ncbi:SAF domain-containing protein [Viridibacillus arvi]|uniref:SAF domain-containing protein n=1 Tax=Viridibacillus arvi TaxID=263475 RepID=UPI0034CDBE72